MRSKNKKRKLARWKSKLGLPDLDHAKAAVLARSVSEISHVTAPGRAFLIRVASRILWGVESGSVNYFVFKKSLPVTAFRVLAPQVVVLSTANDLVKLQNVVSHADQCPLPAYFLQSA